MSDYAKIELKMYLKSFLFGLIILVVTAFYLYARRWNFDLFIANKAIATTSALLIAISLSLSSICYFWNFADTKLAYRKQLGVVGFGLGFIHYILSVWFLSGRFKLDWLVNSNPAIWLAEVALALFLIMAVLSFFELTIIKKFGPAVWHKFLRITGYLALAFVAYHLYILKYKMWLKWFQNFDSPFPPLSLIGIIVIALAFILKLAFIIAKLREKKINQKINEFKNT